MTRVYEKRISDRIEGIFPPSSRGGFNVDDSVVQHQAIGLLDQKYLLAHASSTPISRTYTRVPPLRLLDERDPRLMSAVPAGMGTRSVLTGTLGIPTGLLLLLMLLLSQVLPEMPHRTPHSPPPNSPSQHRPSVQVSPARSHTDSSQSSGSQLSTHNSSATPTPTPSPSIQTASSVTPANTGPPTSTVGGKGGGPNDTPQQTSTPQTTLAESVSQLLPNSTVAVPPMSVPPQTTPLASTSGTALTLN